MKRIVYDAEIKACVPTGERDATLNYCNGWGDKAGMGIACIVAYDLETQQFRVFMDDNLDEFASLVASASHILGWNNHSFDDPLVRTCWGLDVSDKSHDIKKLASIRCSLGAVAAANSIQGKSDKGANAPVYYQRGQYGRLIDYCMQDVWVTSQLLELGASQGSLIDGKGIRKLFRTPPGWSVVEESRISISLQLDLENQPRTHQENEGDTQ